MHNKDFERLPSDLPKDKSRLSETGQLLIKERERILERWATRVRTEIPTASQLANPILIDTLPTLLDNIAEALTPEFPRTIATEDSTFAGEHGGERARLTQYDFTALIAEYQILSDVVFEVLEAKTSLSSIETRVISTSFNSAIREAATAYALVTSELREQFTATITHDLRSPLTSVMMAADIIENRSGYPEDARSLAGVISKNARRMDRMIQNLLDVAYTRTGGRLSLKVTECNMMDVLEEVAATIKLTHGREVDLEGEPVIGFWDVEALRRAIENLAINAIKYGNTALIQFKTTALHGRCITKVHNEGSPIPVSEQETIFQPFRRSRPIPTEKVGWGIGLTVVRAVAEGHGGSIGIDSSPGRGTTFTIDIPLDARPFQTAPTRE